MMQNSPFLLDVQERIDQNGPLDPRHRSPLTDRAAARPTRRAARIVLHLYMT